MRASLFANPNNRRPTDGTDNPVFSRRSFIPGNTTGSEEYQPPPLPYGEKGMKLLPCIKLKKIIYILKTFLVSRPRFFGVLALIQLTLPRLLTITDIYTDVKVAISLYNGNEILFFGMTVLGISFPFIVVWTVSLRFAHRFLYQWNLDNRRNLYNGTSKIIRKLETILINLALVVYLFPPAGCIFMLFHELSWVVSDVVKGVLAFSRGEALVRGADPEITAVKEFRKVVECFGESVPQAFLQLYMFIHRGTVEVDEEELTLSLCISLANTCYIIFKLRRESKFHGMPLAEYAISRMQLCEIPLIKLIPRLPAIERGLVSRVNFANFKFDKQSLGPIIQAISSDTCRLESIKLSMNSLSALDLDACRILGEMLHNSQINIIFSQTNDPKSILNLFRQIDDDRNGYLDFTEFCSAMKELNPSRDPLHYLWIFERLAIRRLELRDRIYFMDFYASLNAYDSETQFKLGDFDVSQIDLPMHAIVKSFVPILETSLDVKWNTVVSETNPIHIAKVPLQTIERLNNDALRAFRFTFGLKMYTQADNFMNFNRQIFSTIVESIHQLSCLQQTLYMWGISDEYTFQFSLGRNNSSRKLGDKSLQNLAIGNVPHDKVMKAIISSFYLVYQSLWGCFDFLLSSPDVIDYLYMRDSIFVCLEETDCLDEYDCDPTDIVSHPLAMEIQKDGYTGINCLEYCVIRKQSRLFAHILNAILPFISALQDNDKKDDNQSSSQSSTDKSSSESALPKSDSFTSSSESDNGRRTSMASSILDIDVVLDCNSYDQSRSSAEIDVLGATRRDSNDISNLHSESLDFFSIFDALTGNKTGENIDNPLTTNIRMKRRDSTTYIFKKPQKDTFLTYVKNYMCFEDAYGLDVMAYAIRDNLKTVVKYYIDKKHVGTVAINDTAEQIADAIMTQMNTSTDNTRGKTSFRLGERKDRLTFLIREQFSHSIDNEMIKILFDNELLFNAETGSNRRVRFQMLSSVYNNIEFKEAFKSKICETFGVTLPSGLDTKRPSDYSEYESYTEGVISQLYALLATKYGVTRSPRSRKSSPENGEKRKSRKSQFKRLSLVASRVATEFIRQSYSHSQDNDKPTDTEV